MPCDPDVQFLRWIEDWPEFSVLSGCALAWGDGAVDYLLGGPGQIVARGGVAGCVHNPDLALLGWPVPTLLARLYRVHSGLGPWRGSRDRWGPGAILPWDEVQPLTARVRFGEDTVLFDPADAVLWMRDGRGGGLVFVGRDAPVIRALDGVRHTLSEPISRSDALAQVVAHWISGLA